MVVSTSHDVLDVHVRLECRMLPGAMSALHSCSWSKPFRAGQGFGTGWTLGHQGTCDVHWAGLEWADDLRERIAELVLFLLIAMSFRGSGGGIGDGCGCVKGLLSLDGTPSPGLPGTLAHVPALCLAMFGRGRVSGLFNGRFVCGVVRWCLVWVFLMGVACCD